MEREMILIGLPIAIIVFSAIVVYVGRRRQRERAIALVKERPEINQWYEAFAGFFQMEPLRFPEFKVIAHSGDTVVVRVYELVLDTGEKRDFAYYEVNLQNAVVTRRTYRK